MPVFEFNREEVTQPYEAFEPVPKADYELMLVHSDIGPTSSGTGQVMKAEFEIVSGQYGGRKVFENFNIFNPNATAQDIGRRKLLSLAQAVGYPIIPKDSQDLHNRVFVGSVEIEKGTNGYKDKNVIASYKSKTALGNIQPQPAAANPAPVNNPAPAYNPPASNAAPAAAGNGGRQTPPWQK